MTQRMTPESLRSMVEQLLDVELLPLQTQVKDLRDANSQLAQRNQVLDTTLQTLQNELTTVSNRLDRLETTLAVDATSAILKDTNGNSVTLGPEGIALKSMGSLTATVVFGSSVSLSAAGIALNSSLDISAAATSTFTATGGSAAKITSSGETTIQGAMVLIN